MVEEFYYQTNLVKEQEREIQRLKEQNDALRRARNQAVAHSQHTKGYSGKRRDSSEHKEEGEGNIENRFPKTNPRDQPVKNLKFGKEKDQSCESTQDGEEPNSAEVKPMGAQEGGGRDVTVEPVQTQDSVVPYPRNSHDSSRAPSNQQWNVVIPVENRRTKSGKVKRQRNPNDPTRGPGAWKIRQEKAIARANHGKAFRPHPRLQKLPRLSRNQRFMGRCSGRG